MRSPAAAAMSPSPNTSPHLPDSRFGADAHAPGLVAVGYGLEQEARAFDVAGQVAQFVDDRRFGLADRLGFGVEAVVVFGLARLTKVFAFDKMLRLSSRLFSGIDRNVITELQVILKYYSRIMDIIMSFFRSPYVYIHSFFIVSIYPYIST